MPPNERRTYSRSPQPQQLSLLLARRLLAVGATLAALVFANWSYILSVTKSSVSAAASLLALMGLALVYASREVRLGAARSAA